MLTGIDIAHKLRPVCTNRLFWMALSPLFSLSASSSTLELESYCTGLGAFVVFSHSVLQALEEAMHCPALMYQARAPQELWTCSLAAAAAAAAAQH